MTDPRLETFRQLVEEQQARRVRTEYQHVKPPAVTVKPGKRWTKVDVGDSGKYVVDTDGTIYGIKAYGVPHFSHRFGTLGTINEWDWSGYAAVPAKGR